ncbi:glucokinase [Undibacterium macrobrachii]|jgi:glucokinase|uniref:Glucokinase n=1 Tax=Undibacterium macrobrachii TaxID=1119058 RepID=A0ABQ2XJS1_9BURK|nr:glucokinase [Undibacterium macrobrachii]GGX20392.1 glucokinase [Undibacterium macrobrachii]
MTTASNLPPTPTAPYPWLIADIGGSNARFGWVAAAGADITQVKTLAVTDFATPIAASETYLQQLQQELGKQYQAPRCAAFAVATAVGQEQIQFTNSHWKFTRTEVKAALQLDRFIALNDFEALALSLPRLKAEQIRAHGALPEHSGTLAVVGPGTGLGVGSVIETRHGWIAIPGEGGHATLAATDDFEASVLNHARLEFHHISAERLLSGIGLPVLYRAVARSLQLQSEELSTEQIVERGLQAQDAVCAKTLDCFCALLGSFCGNIALTVGARSGLYIGGGIVPRLGDYFFTSRFRSKFEAKGRFQSYLQQIPTALITDTLAALSGAAFAIEQSEE